MRPKRSNKADNAEQTTRDVRRATRRQYSAKEKSPIVLEGLRGEQSIAELMTNPPQVPVLQAFMLLRESPETADRKQLTVPTALLFPAPAV